MKSKQQSPAPDSCFQHTNLGKGVAADDVVHEIDALLASDGGHRLLDGVIAIVDAMIGSQIKGSLQSAKGRRSDGCEFNPSRWCDHRIYVLPAQT